jgi:D-alanyl-D-alanine endopeptidase (penicillin-binding protein 7)
MQKAMLLGLVVCLCVALPHPDGAEAKKARGKRKSKPIAALTKEGLPNVQAKGAIVIDMATGTEIYGKDADTPRPIASTTKIFVAMVVRSRGLDLDGETTITEDDQKAARGGAKSRLLVGRRFKNVDLLRAMLIASDNRACTALGRAVGLTPEQLVDEMNKLARKLGLKRTRFTDTSGLRGNESTPREMAIALEASLEDPLLVEIMTTKQVTVSATDAGEVKGEGQKQKKAKKKGAYAVTYNNTNVSLREGRWVVIGGKTGYTDAARYCLVIAAEIGGVKVVMSFYGAEGELTRFADFSRVAQWMESGGPGKQAARTSGVGALADPPPPAVGGKLLR